MNRAAAGTTSPLSARPAEADRAALVAAVLIGGVALALRVALSPQFDGLDDVGYLEAARRISQGQPLDSMFPLFQMRVGMSYPLGWLLKAGVLQTSQLWLLTTVAECITLVALFTCARLPMRSDG